MLGHRVVCISTHLMVPELSSSKAVFPHPTLSRMQHESGTWDKLGTNPRSEEPKGHIEKKAIKIRGVLGVSRKNGQSDLRNTTINVSSTRAKRAPSYISKIVFKLLSARVYARAPLHNKAKTLKKILKKYTRYARVNILPVIKAAGLAPMGKGSTETPSQSVYPEPTLYPPQQRNSRWIESHLDLKKASVA